jgi:phosphoglycolate phosphatase
MKRAGPLFTKKCLFIFDLDGTLIDAYQAISRSLNHTRRFLGYPPVGFRKAKKSVGKGERHFISLFFPAREVEQALALYRRHHKKELTRYTRVKPHAHRLLRALKQRGCLVAIASNRPSIFTGRIVKGLRLRKYFDLIVCGDQIQRLKPHPKILRHIMRAFKVPKESAVFIGDMSVDMETAARAGVDAVFIKGGSDSVSQIKDYPVRKVISSLKEILNEVRAIEACCP